MKCWILTAWRFRESISNSTLRVRYFYQKIADAIRYRSFYSYRSASQARFFGVTLVKGDLRGIVRARRLSRMMMRNIRENLFFAFIYNSLGVPVAAGVLYPVFGLLLSPMIAAAAMSFSSVSVITNALRLRRARI